MLAFLLVTALSNHCEAEDAYAYARLAEQGAWNELFHAHHLLYLPLMRGLVSAAAFFGYDGRAFPLLIGFSMLCGAAAICLFFALTDRRRQGLCFSAALLFSYGFWRYSTTAEIYVPVSLLCLFAWFCARRSDESPLFFWCSAVSAAAALLLHVVSWPLVLAALPLFYLASGRAGRAALYLTAVLMMVAAAYISAMSGPGLTVFADESVMRQSWMMPAVWLKAAAAFGQNIGSANFLFALEPAARQIQALFPYHMLQEELFAGRTVPTWIVFAAPVTFAALIATVGALMFSVMRSLKHRIASEPLRAAVPLIWFGGTVATAFVFEPANPEMWICSLVPFWLLMDALWEPAQTNRVLRQLPAALAGLLLLHNAVGGIGVVKSPESDYARQKTAWIVREATADDAVLLADSHATVSFLRYHGSARVVDAKFLTPDAWRRIERETAGRIFVFEDVVELLPPVARRAPQAVRRIEQTTMLFEDELVPVHTGRFGAVYQWTGK